ncbi:MAG: tyrosine-type recombinase/integrase [Defluviitaleaceae bacterium]|nr:tyrosine-type recombinase/integrase [Defluviitaleaceae bacterium]
MEQTRTISALSAELLLEMDRMGYSKSLIRHFKVDCERFSEFSRETTGNDCFDEKLGEKYLAERFGYPELSPVKLPRPVCNAVRCVRRLGEYRLFGVITRQWASPERTDWYLDDEQVINAYLDNTQTADGRKSTKALRRRDIKKFYVYIAFHKATGIHDLSNQLISGFALSLQGMALTSSQRVLATLRNYCHFLYKNGYCPRDWSFHVPKVHAPKNLTIPALWEQSEIELLLNSVDRTSPLGKRDYAVMLLALTLGLRSSDIAGLELESLKWERNEIDLIQRKTGNRLVQPLLGDVGWAIIDYIRYARPKIESPFVFFTVNAPYTQLKAASTSAILNRYMCRCGIVKPSGTTRGMHSLRHAFARRLLEQGTPLPEVADIMGHTSYSGTSPYLKVDIDGLRTCSLSITEVVSNA